MFAEPFSQLNDYGNGAGYVLIVPDAAVVQMRMLYSVYAAVTSPAPDLDDLTHILTVCDGLVPLEWGRAVTASNGMPTRFLYGDKDYLSGKWMDKSEIHFFLSHVDLSVLSGRYFGDHGRRDPGDWTKKESQDRILRQLGMNERMIGRLQGRQLAQIFLLPVLPALLVSSCLVLIAAKKILLGFFQLPVLPDILWIGQSFGISLALFSVLYAVYYAAARICYGRR